MKLFGKTKIWIIIALAIAVLGGAFIGIFGFNQTPDYKTAYEVTVGVDQDVENSGETVKAAAEKYFAEQGYRFSSYATQKAGEGKKYIYKFNSAGNITEGDLKAALDQALNENADLAPLGVETDVGYKQTAITAYENAGALIAASAVALLCAFVIALFTVKLAGATTVVCNAVITAAIFTALIAITRLPAAPYLAATGAVGIAFSVVFTFALTCGYKGALKADGKAGLKELAFAGVKRDFAKICFTVCAGVFAALSFAVIGGAYLVFTGAQFVLAIASAAVVSCVSTPALWSSLKKLKSGK